MLGVNHVKAMWAYKRGKTKVSFPPFKVYIEPTNHCNLACPTCPHSIMGRPKGFMTKETFNNILKEADYIKKAFLFHTGESLLHPDFFWMVKELNARKVYTVLYTNANFLTDEKAKKLLEAKIDFVSVSFHQSKVEEKVKSFQKLAEETKAKTKIIVQVLPGEEPPTDIEFKQRKLHNYVGDIPDEKIVENYGQHFKPAPGKKYSGCIFPYYEINILWNGDVIACCRDYEGLYKLGNINKDKLKDMWNGEKMQALRSDLHNQRPPMPCAKCDRLYEDELTPSKIVREVFSING